MGVFNFFSRRWYGSHPLCEKPVWSVLFNIASEIEEFDENENEKNGQHHQGDDFKKVLIVVIPFHNSKAG
jgi:hypothetical protein